jgi:hypothetical protein
MSNNPGRNDPCRCGSGKTYKRCCLPADEAAARERAVQPLFEDVFGDDDFDADDEIEEYAPIIDVAALIRVCYTRGFMSKLSDLRSGRGVRVTEWDAPHIPQAVLDSIEREGIDILEGKWGDPKSGDPIQVDVIDLETVTAVVSVEVFNRAIAMVHGDDEEIRRIHRMCGVLEAAAADEADQSAEQRAGATTLTIVRSDEPPRPSARVDISDVLKEHRHQGGTCALCGEAVTRARAQKHLAACAPIHSVADGTEQRLIHIRATAPTWRRTGWIWRSRAQPNSKRLTRFCGESGSNAAVT